MGLNFSRNLSFTLKNNMILRFSDELVVRFMFGLLRKKSWLRAWFTSPIYLMTQAIRNKKKIVVSAKKTNSHVHVHTHLQIVIYITQTQTAHTHTRVRLNIRSRNITNVFDGLTVVFSKSWASGAGF